MSNMIAYIVSAHIPTLTVSVFRKYTFKATFSQNTIWILTNGHLYSVFPVVRDHVLTINISSGYVFYLYSVVISLPRFVIEKLQNISITGTFVRVCV